MPKLDQNVLAHFTGSETFYRHSLMRSVVYTEGVKYVADAGEAHWLLDKIATLQLEAKVRKEEFQVWKLKVKDGSATLTLEDGNDKVVYWEAIPDTDFPEPGITIWFTDNTMLLPTEY